MTSKLEILYEDKITNLNEKIEDLMQLLSNRDKQIQDFKQEKENTKQQYRQSNQKQLENVSREMEDALNHEKEKVHQQYSIDVKEKNKVIQDLKIDLQKKEEKINNTQTQIDQLNNCLESRLKSNKELHDTISSLESKLRKKDQINSELCNELETYKKSDSRSDVQLDNYRNRCNDLEQDIRNKDDVISSLQKQMLVLQEHQQQNDNDDQILIDKDEYQSMKKQINKAKRIIEEDADKQNLTSGLDATRSHNALKEVVSVLKARLRDAEAKVANMEEIQQHNVQLQKDYERLQLDIQNIEKDKIQSKADVQNVVKESHEQIMNLKKQLCDAIHRKEYVEKKLETNARLLGQAESLMAQTNQNTLNAIMDAISKNKPSSGGDSRYSDLPR